MPHSGFKDKTIIYQHKDIQQECYNLQLYCFKAPAVIVVIYAKNPIRHRQSLKTATKLLFSVHSTNEYNFEESIGLLRKQVALGLQYLAPAQLFEF